MTMPSSVGDVSNPRGRPALFLAAVALAALAVALVLAFAPVPSQRSGTARSMEAQPPIAAPIGAPPPASTSAGTEKERGLWMLLAPWALRVDALAVLGAAVVLALHIGLRRGGRART